MQDRESEPEAGVDDSDEAARINFRDYPSSAVVVLAALGSGLAWLMYKWRKRKGSGQATTSDDAPSKTDASLRRTQD
ncbi:hypothetical protein DES45_104473 [Microvirga subterranea]|uniref:Uncharacterized protein n=1 Tax=Microvirga subterranea TaxID=186651 RepID=A0A370HRK1_9HYPH|nr:hypothetical protein DES45_104473 [Microvirga subterranea]